ncbi:N-alpha-acetyltransferase 80 [Dendropsophus ebraccatus]|uniref:N-alpha-acetyltransferase 80 n=1 Tax=Dendropsophus ebraccatus TaxID=150705 RepID=UPI0038318A5C
MGESAVYGAASPSSVVLVPLHHRPDLTASCAELLNQTWKRSLGARMHSLERSSDDFPVCLVLIRDPKGPALGHARLCRVVGMQDSLFVESVVVSTELRGKGYGRKLMEATERYARGKGFRNLYLTTHDKQDFYYHLGYRLSEPVHNMGSLNSLLPAGMIQKMATTKTNPVLNHPMSSSTPLCPPTSTSASSTTSCPLPPPPLPPMLFSMSPHPTPPLSPCFSSSPAPPLPPPPPPPPTMLCSMSPHPTTPLSSCSSSSPPPPPPPPLPPPPPMPLSPSSLPPANQDSPVFSLQTPYWDFRGDPIFWMKKCI